MYVSPPITGRYSGELRPPRTPRKQPTIPMSITLTGAKHTQMDIAIPYSPRSMQQELHQLIDTNRFTVIVCHRRAGKTVAAINHLLRDAILCPKKNPRYAYLAATFTQAKRIAWDYLKQFAGGIPGVKFNETELRCDLPNGARIMLLSAENPDALRGIYLDGCVMDEVAMMPESVFPMVLRPALADRSEKGNPKAGYCCFLGTPAGHNLFFDYWKTAADTEDWARIMFKASETGILPESELEAARVAMSEDQYEQEFECSFVANTPGAIFGKELQAIEAAGQVCRVPYDETKRVDTWWDIGMADATSVVFTQTVGNSSVNVIDYFEMRGEGLPFYARMLDQKGYVYGTHNGPHDLEVREMGTGRSRREIAYDLGINFRVIAKLPLEDGIHAAKTFIKRCYFDSEATSDLLEKLRLYHRKYDEKNRQFRTSVVHDFTSHAADAFRGLAVGWKPRSELNVPPQQSAEMNYNPLASTSI